ncbi:hypothetical protein HMN09_00038700 [Mycena chlorophos]|uniref:Zinc-ribbon 15 domain-containing protein n=1 Tax=Mycena chlorophos TaxID=658473 RepID=A0A8H6TTR3_MYCCL|nr:hypothetical protein HMN09_00038700 [Mycena chlorophos]
MFICLPILCGLQQKVKPAGDSDVRVCPNCHNASVFSAKKSEWFTLFFIPLIPFSSKRVWVCQICRWIAPHAAGQFEPAVAHGVFIQPSYQPGYVNAVPSSTPSEPSYQPAYIK